MYRVKNGAAFDFEIIFASSVVGAMYLEIRTAFLFNVLLQVRHPHLNSGGILLVIVRVYTYTNSSALLSNLSEVRIAVHFYSFIQERFRTGKRSEVVVWMGYQFFSKFWGDMLLPLTLRVRRIVGFGRARRILGNLQLTGDF